MKYLDINEVKEVIAKSSDTTSIYIGCDSRVHKRRGQPDSVSYVRAVIIHHDSKHGAIIFGDVQTAPDYATMKFKDGMQKEKRRFKKTPNSIRMRMMQEVYFATEIAMELVDVIGDRHFEIHLDINPDKNHNSNIAMKEAMGYVRGCLGKEPKIKPHAWAASTAADRYTGIKHAMKKAS